MCIAKRASLAWLNARCANRRLSLRSAPSVLSLRSTGLMPARHTCTASFKGVRFLDVVPFLNFVMLAPRLKASCAARLSARAHTKLQTSSLRPSKIELHAARVTDHDAPPDIASDSAVMLKPHASKLFRWL